ncbi:MAG: hypothetical protein DRO87_08510 [Candidatus Thorarchaeota archaeon]|nr:MAG: hypothetical protein DRO87_08510 [Candidatus Thorarchaeota archaeon]
MKDWRDRLVERYPSLYGDRKKDPKRVSMSYPSVGDGWREIIENLSRDISKIDRHNLVRVEQVKEKFGTLRFYFSVREHDEVDHRDLLNRVFALVAKAEEHSQSVCEKCGAPGALYGNDHGWLKVLCDDCRKEE